MISLRLSRETVSTSFVPRSSGAKTDPILATVVAAARSRTPHTGHFQNSCEFLGQDLLQAPERLYHAAQEAFSGRLFTTSDTELLMTSTDGLPIFVDLFCGAGGLSDGLRQAGFRPALGIDVDPHATASYRANHVGTPVFQSDVAKITPQQIYSAVGSRDITLIAGGPSCQGYSTTGKRIEDDPRNFLFKQFARLVREVRPEFFLMENVKGLLTFRKGYFRRLIEESFAEAGYSVISKVLCAADYGVPQLRHRIVFLGTRRDVPLCFPPPTHGTAKGLKPYVTVGDAISDLPLLEGTLRADAWTYASGPQSSFQKYARAGHRSKHVLHHHANGLSPMASQVVRMLKEGQGIRSIPPELLPDRFKRMRRIKNGSLRKDCTTLYHRISRDAPAYTITCYFRNVASGPFVHPLENRSLSYREAARLMSFQDKYRFCGAKLAHQIGNAVPPLLAKALGKHILSLRASGDADPTEPWRTVQKVLPLA